MKFYLSRKEQYVIVVLLVAVFAAVLVLSYGYGHNTAEAKKQPPFLELHDSPPVADTTTPATAAQIVVHVTGAVQKPGLYTFQPGDRVDTAVQRAGGARADGYPDALNLAAKLEDGQKIYIPTKTEWQATLAQDGPPPLIQSASASPSATVGAPKPAHASPASTAPSAAAVETLDRSAPKPLPTKKVNINTATVEDFATLPGIGEVTAQRIVEYRAQHGKFTDTAQLLDIPRIGAKTLERLAPYITL